MTDAAFQLNLTQLPSVPGMQLMSPVSSSTRTTTVLNFGLSASKKFVRVLKPGGQKLKRNDVIRESNGVLGKAVYVGTGDRVFIIDSII